MGWFSNHDDKKEYLIGIVDADILKKQDEINKAKELQLEDLDVERLTSKIIEATRDCYHTVHLDAFCKYYPNHSFIWNYFASFDYAIDEPYAYDMGGFLKEFLAQWHESEDCKHAVNTYRTAITRFIAETEECIELLRKRREEVEKGVNID